MGRISSDTRCYKMLQKDTTCYTMLHNEGGNIVLVPAGQFLCRLG